MSAKYQTGDVLRHTNGKPYRVLEVDEKSGPEVDYLVESLDGSIVPGNWENDIGWVYETNFETAINGGDQ